MASRKTKHTKTTTSEEQKKALIHSQGSAGRSFVYFSGCQRPENRLEKIKISANGDL